MKEENGSTAPGILPVPRSKKEAKRFYDRISKVYDYLTRVFERKYAEMATECLSVEEGETVLEIGFGTGHCLKRIAESVGQTGKVYGNIAKQLDFLFDKGTFAEKRLLCETFFKRFYIEDGKITTKNPELNAPFRLIASEAKGSGCFQLGRGLWKKIRTTNVLERDFWEVSRRTRPMGVFPHEHSAERIFCGVTNGIHQNGNGHHPLATISAEMLTLPLREIALLTISSIRHILNY